MFIRQDGPLLRAYAPAKLNLFLEVLGKRSDGYHEIETLMVAVNTFDTLTFSPRDDAEFHLTVDGPWGGERNSATARHDALPTDARDNLVVRALRLLKERSGTERGMDVHLHKRIPPASGLGGGSSNAAATLLAANLVWGLGYARSELAEIAAEMGSDIPFFLTARTGRSAMAARCIGRGEVVQPVSIPATMHFVIVRPEFGLSTPEIYQRCRAAEQPQRAERLLQALGQGNLRIAGNLMTNRLQEPAREVAAALDSVAEGFSSLGAVGHQLSGSGSAYFGSFSSARSAKRAAVTFRARGWTNAWYAQAV